MADKKQQQTIIDDSDCSLHPTPSGVPRLGIHVYRPCFVRHRPKKNIGSSGREIAAGSWTTSGGLRMSLASLAELSQLLTFFNVFDLIFIVKPCVFIGAL
jgi:hypothetical protein